MKWEQDQSDGVLGWNPPRKGETAQPRWTNAVTDLDEVFSDPQVRAVLDRWGAARLHEAPAYSGGVLDVWPALMVDGLAVCRHEEAVISDWVRHLNGPESSPSR